MSIQIVSRCQGVILVAALLVAAPLRAQLPVMEPDTLMRQRIESALVLRAGGEVLDAPDAVRAYYRANGFHLLWSTPGAVPAAAQSLLAFVDGIGADGLRPNDYHPAPIRGALDVATRAGGVLPPRERVELDLLLTDAFLHAAHDLLQGRIRPQAIHPAWTLAGRQADPTALLGDAVRRNRVEDALGGLRPATPQYTRLREALARYRATSASGGWPQIPARTLRPGDTVPEVAALRRRVAAEGVWLPEADSARYDSALVGAVRVLQRRHGLNDDGVVGPGTRAALNTPPDERVRQLEAALERERWMPPTLGERYIAVYIPAFELQAVDSGRVTLGMRVIAGKPSWRTPIFSGRMTGVVFNPYWNIPPSIWSREVALRAAREPGYLARQGISAVQDGATTRWRQNPGPMNPLGQVKLVFPNQFNVYLHDTSSPSLFRRDERALSHGCIRLENPLALTAFVLNGTTGWSPAAVERAAAGDTERGVRIGAPLPVYIFYRTAWVEDSGAVQFRPDVYGHDALLAQALQAPDPAAWRAPPERAAGEGL
jgi:L,D-transpeptidase YcbB